MPIKGIRWLLPAFILLAGTVIAQQAVSPGSDESDKTIAACYKRIADNPTSAEPWRDLGIAFYQKGNLAKAEDALKQAIHIKPDAQSNLCLGLVFEKQGEPDKAIDAYSTALNLNPRGKVRSEVRTRLDRLMADKFKRDASQVIANEKSIKAESIPENTIAVVNFDGSRLSPDLAPIGTGFAEFTANDLSKVHSLQVVDRLKLDVLLGELKLGQSGAVDPKTAPRVGKLVGGHQVVTGSLISSGDNQVRLDGAIVNTTDGNVDVTKSSEGDVKSFFKIEKEFVFSVLDKLGITPTAEEREAINKIPTESYIAFMAYCRGLDYQQRGMFREAQGEFNTASSQDKNFAAPKSQLTTVAALSAPDPGSPQSIKSFETTVIGAGPGIGFKGGLQDRLDFMSRTIGTIPSLSGDRPALSQPRIAPNGVVIIRGTFDVQ
jgi:tetratricopeptide (TPR) repeat protein